MHIGVIHEKARALIDLAESVGWRSNQRLNGGVLLTSPTTPRVTVVIEPDRSYQDSRGSQIAMKILKNGDPVMVAAQAATSGVVRAAQPGNHGKKIEKRPAPTPAPTPTFSSRVDAAVRAAAAVPVPAAGRTLVSAGPWLAKRGMRLGGGVKYESQTTTERHWSDGSIDYACQFSGCDFTNERPQSVARHWGRSKDHPVAEQDVAMRVDPDYEVGPSITYNGRESARQKRLAAEILHAITQVDPDLTLMNAPMLAEALASAMLRDRDEDSEARKQSEPLTPEQILDKIRLLVDDGSWMRMREEELTRKQQIVDLQAAVETERARAQAASDRWAALVSIVQGETDPA